MSTTDTTVDAQRERANDLYWNSSDTVDKIAEQLGMSRNALYASVRPQPVGVDCPDCGEELVFPNRTSRATGQAMCLACEHTVPLDDLARRRVLAAARGPARAHSHSHEGHSYDGRDLGYGDGGGPLRNLREGLAAVEPERVALIGGAATLGAVVGAAAVSLIRRLS